MLSLAENKKNRVWYPLIMGQSKDETLVCCFLAYVFCVILLYLPFSWNSGQNHVIFSMLSGTYPHFNSTPDVLYDCAVIAGGSLHSTTYRRGFDVAIPVYNSLTYASKYRYTAVNRYAL